MNRLSGCISEWDSDDYKLLVSIKKEKTQTSITASSDQAIARVLTRLLVTVEEQQEEQKRHGKRFESLILGLTGTTDMHWCSSSSYRDGQHLR